MILNHSICPRMFVPDSEKRSSAPASSNAALSSHDPAASPQNGGGEADDDNNMMFWTDISSLLVRKKEVRGRLEQAGQAPMVKYKMVLILGWSNSGWS